jgi:hypothetical protein
MSFVARWSFDVPFGKKPEAFKVLDGWEQYAQETGWPVGRQLVASIGPPESRVEIEYTFDHLSRLEDVWERLSGEKFKTWQAQLAPFVVPGSPHWEIYRLRKHD